MGGAGRGSVASISGFSPRCKWGGIFPRLAGAPPRVDMDTLVALVLVLVSVLVLLLSLFKTVTPYSLVTFCRRRGAALKWGCCGTEETGPRSSGWD